MRGESDVDSRNLVASKLCRPLEPDVPSDKGNTPGLATGSRALARRASWGVADQALSSLTNFALTISVARAVTTAEFGAFAVAYAAYLMFIQLSRAMSSEPLVVRYSSTTIDRWRSGSEAACGTAVAVGLVTGGATACVGLLVGGSMRAGLFALAIMLPGLLLQDALRLAFFAQGHPAKAAANDFIWAIIQLPAIILLLKYAHPSVSTLILVWGASAAVAGAVGCLQGGILPRPLATWTWAFREHRDIAPRFVVEFLFRTSNQLTIYAVGLVGGIAVVGSLRAAWVLFGPLNILFLGAFDFAVPEVSRLLTHGERAFKRAIDVLSVGLGAVGLAWTILLLLLPSTVGEALLGQSWSSARPLLIPIGIVVMTSGITIGPWAALRALQAADASMRARMLIAPVMLVSGMTGALMGAALGAACGIAAASCWATVIWWRQYENRRTVRQTVVGDLT